MQNHIYKELQVRLKILVLLWSKNGLRSDPRPSNSEKISWRCIPQASLARHSCVHMCRTVQASPSHTLSHPFHKEGWGHTRLRLFLPPPYQMSSAIVETYGTTRSTRTKMHMMATKYIYHTLPVAQLVVLYKIKNIRAVHCTTYLCHRFQHGWTDILNSTKFHVEVQVCKSGWLCISTSKYYLGFNSY